MRTPDALRLAGAVSGAATPGFVAAIAWWLGFEPVAGIAVGGTPIGLVVGWWLGPRSSGRALSTWLIAAVSSIGIAIAAVAVVGLFDLITDGGDNPSTDAGMAVYLLPLVVGYAFIFGMPVAAPVTGLWTLLVRLVAARPRIGWPVVGLMGVTAIALGLAAVRFGPELEARRGDDLRRSGTSPMELALGRTEVRWTFRNCASWPYSVVVTSHPLVGDAVGVRWMAAGHSTTSGSAVVEPGWMFEIEPDQSAALPPAYLGPKGVLDDPPGAVVEVEIEAGPTGEWSDATTIDGRSLGSLVTQCRSTG